MSNKRTVSIVIAVVLVLAVIGGFIAFTSPSDTQGSSTFTTEGPPLNRPAAGGPTTAP
jgi:flagellar basal body-associated protein FliL